MNATKALRSADARHEFPEGFDEGPALCHAGALASCANSPKATGSYLSAEGNKAYETAADSKAHGSTPRSRGQKQRYALQIRYVLLTIKESVAVVHLTRGLHAIIDAADAQLITGMKWSAHCVSPRSGLTYASSATAAKLCGSRYMHRLIAGGPDAPQVDHRNGNTLDNRRENLRPVSAGLNRCNSKMRIRRGDRATPYKCVRRSGSRFAAATTYKGRAINLGTFDTAEEAARAYDRFALSTYGAHARLNFPRRGGGVTRFNVTPCSHPASAVPLGARGFSLPRPHAKAAGRDSSAHGVSAPPQRMWQERSSEPQRLAFSTHPRRAPRPYPRRGGSRRLAAFAHNHGERHGL